MNGQGKTGKGRQGDGGWRLQVGERVLDLAEEYGWGECWPVLATEGGVA